MAYRMGYRDGRRAAAELALMDDKDNAQVEYHQRKYMSKITIADVEEQIESESYFTAREGLEGSIVLSGTTPGWPCEDVSQLIPPRLDCLTICVLVMTNGFVITGESCCVNSEDFDSELGRKYALENALDKAFAYVAYERRSKITSYKEASDEHFGREIF